jgi:hypothetical protein
MELTLLPPVKKNYVPHAEEGINILIIRQNMK